MQSLSPWRFKFRTISSFISIILMIYTPFICSQESRIPKHVRENKSTFINLGFDEEPVRYLKWFGIRNVIDNYNFFFFYDFKSSKETITPSIDSSCYSSISSTKSLAVTYSWENIAIYLERNRSRPFNRLRSPQQKQILDEGN